MKDSSSLRLFSQETLDSAVMAEIYGGDTPNNCNGGNCSTTNRLLCGLEININFGAKCKEGCRDNTPET